MEIIQISGLIVSAYVAWIATRALNTWKQQLKAQKQTDFMDAITEAVHEFIRLMDDPIDKVKFVKSRIKNYEGYIELDQSLENSEAITYIQSHGQEDAKQLYEYLKPCTHILSKIDYLVVKGDVLGFKNYNECQNACSIITFQYNRIQYLRYIIGTPTLYWNNPEIQEALSKVIHLDPNDIEKQIKEQKVKILNFVDDNYKTIYK